jgi:hypothetical protein
LYWKGKRRFPFQTNPFLVIHPAAELQGILSIKRGRNTMPANIGEMVYYCEMPALA